MEKLREALFCFILINLQGLSQFNFHSFRHILSFLWFAHRIEAQMCKRLAHVQIQNQCLCLHCCKLLPSYLWLVMNLARSWFYQGFELLVAEGIFCLWFKRSHFYQARKKNENLCNNNKNKTKFPNRHQQITETKQQTNNNKNQNTGFQVKTQDFVLKIRTQLIVAQHFIVSALQILFLFFGHLVYGKKICVIC